MLADILGQPYSWAAIGVVLVVAARVSRAAVTVGIVIVGVLALGYFEVVSVPGLR